MASGRKKVPRWACSKCLRTSTKPLTAEQVKEQANPNRLHDALSTATKVTKEKNGCHEMLDL